MVGNKNSMDINLITVSGSSHESSASGREPSEVSLDFIAFPTFVHLEWLRGAGHNGMWLPWGELAIASVVLSGGGNPTEPKGEGSAYDLVMRS
jgi:hypothetical protein